MTDSDWEELAGVVAGAAAQPAPSDAANAARAVVQGRTFDGGCEQAQRAKMLDSAALEQLYLISPEQL